MTKQSWTVWQLASEDEYGNSLEDPGVIITTADGETEITGLIHDPTHAPVIAASPELLDALKDALEALEGFLPEDYSNDTEPDQDMRAALKARTAIAKAEGGAASVCGDHRQPSGQDRAKRGQRGYDGGKKTKGRKRHLAIDTMGWPLAVAVHSAAISDTRGAHLVLIHLFLILPSLLKILSMAAINRASSIGARPCLVT